MINLDVCVRLDVFDTQNQDLKTHLWHGRHSTKRQVGAFSAAEYAFKVPFLLYNLNNFE